MKKFVYQVANFEFVDTTAFGSGWAQAKEKASELHAPIFRLVIKEGCEPRQEVFYKGGLFNSVEFMRDDNVKVF